MNQTVLDSKEFQSLAKKRTKKGKRSKKEERVQVRIAKYVKLQYPDVIFNSDIASGMKLPIWVGAVAKSQRSERGQPDMVFLEPRGKYHGLCLEIKRDADQVYKKDGSKRQGKAYAHIEEQEAILERLRKKGYMAEFGLGFDGSKKIIDNYMSL